MDPGSAFYKMAENLNMLNIGLGYNSSLYIGLYICVHIDHYRYGLYTKYIDIQLKQVLLSLCKLECCNSRMILLCDINFILFRLLHVIMHHGKIPIEFYFHLKDDVAFECKDSRLS